MAKCEAMHRVELSYLRRQGMLRPGCRASLQWTSRGEPSGSIGLRTSADGIRLLYVVTEHDGARQGIDEFIPFATSRTNFGGIRSWLTCLACRRRVGVLYGGKHFRCRTCCRLHYASQYEPSYQRAIDQADKLRKRLGGDYGAFNGMPFPDKPKRMRWATYARHVDRYARLTDCWAAGVMAKFGTLR